jgi:drug/metabolite transporter (DMT)-like permease
VHILGLGAWSTQRDALGLSVLQMGVITVVCALASAPDGIVLPQRADDWLAVIYMALIAGALALLAQTWAQAHLAPTRAAIVMTLEPVFAALFAVLLGGEVLTWRMAIGGALVLTAMYLVELSPRRKVEGEVQHLVV